MNKSHNIAMRVTKPIAAALEKAASSDKRTVSWYACMLIEKALKKDGWLK